jgi:hypothetical protein
MILRRLGELARFFWLCVSSTLNRAGMPAALTNPMNPKNLELMGLII